MEREFTRRELFKLSAAIATTGVLSIAWDSVVNEGHPAQTEQPSEDGGEDEPCTSSA